jgi:hypothetical protein
MVRPARLYPALFALSPGLSAAAYRQLHSLKSGGRGADAGGETAAHLTAP